MGWTVIPAGQTAVELLDDDDRVVWHQTHDRGGFEPQSLAVWSDAVEPGEIALDIGSYTGLYAIAAAKLGGVAVAVEPIAVSAQRIRENARHNGVKVRVIEAAASDRTGKAAMFSRVASGLPSGAKIATKSKGAFRQHVDMFRLDSMFALRPVAVMKLDVERHEPRTLAGAQEILSRWKPPIIIEALGDGEAVKILDAIPQYRVVEILDDRNLFMVPR